MERGDPCNPDDIEPDHSLKTWEKWVKIRQNQTQKLGECTERPPADLVMNLLEKVREDKERKEVLEHAQLEKKQANCRGTLWERPHRLKQMCYYSPAYEFQRTAAEKGRPKIIEHIGVPQIIQEVEKGISGVPKRKPHVKLDASYEKYRDKRESILHHKIKKLDPYRPQLNDLLVQGFKPKPPPEKPAELPQILLTEFPPSYEDADTGTYAMRINNTVILKDCQIPSLTELYDKDWHEACSSWNYYFNVPVNKVGRSKMTITNLGTVTIRYCWKKIKISIPFISEDLYESVFYFNKNEDVLFPGHTKEILFSFVSEKPGIFNESWELSTCNINFFQNLGDKLVMNFYADAVDDMEEKSKKVTKLKQDIRMQAIYFNMYNILLEIVDKSMSTMPETYPYHKLFVEGDLFVTRNPVCFYHQTEVDRMKEWYLEMVPDGKWDLYITSWRRAMMDLDYEDRMRYYDYLKESHKDLLLPFFEGEVLEVQKHRVVSLLLGQLADKFDSEYDRLLDMKDSGMCPMSDTFLTNTFYLHMYEHVGDAMEQCAGVISSLDLQRWIAFDFCRLY